MPAGGPRVRRSGGDYAPVPEPSLALSNLSECCALDPRGLRTGPVQEPSLRCLILGNSSSSPRSPRWQRVPSPRTSPGRPGATTARATPASRATTTRPSSSAPTAIRGLEATIPPPRKGASPASSRPRIGGSTSRTSTIRSSAIPTGTGTTRVSDIVADADGVLWMSTWRGALKFDPARGSRLARELRRREPGARRRRRPRPRPARGRARSGSRSSASVARRAGGRAPHAGTSDWHFTWTGGRRPPGRNAWPQLVWSVERISVQPKPGAVTLVWADSANVPGVVVFDSDTQLWTTRSLTFTPGAILDLPGKDWRRRCRQPLGLPLRRTVGNEGHLFARRSSLPGRSRIAPGVKVNSWWSQSWVSLSNTTTPGRWRCRPRPGNRRPAWAERRSVRRSRPAGARRCRPGGRAAGPVVPVRGARRCGARPRPARHRSRGARNQSVPSGARSRSRRRRRRAPGSRRRSSRASRDPRQRGRTSAPRARSTSRARRRRRRRYRSRVSCRVRSDGR